MKKNFFLILLFLSLTKVNAQIADVQQKGSWLYVYNENNKELSHLSLSHSDQYIGMGSSFYIVQKGSWLYVYDSNSKEISHMSLSSSDKVKSVGGNNFNLQKGSWIYTYDKNCKEVSHRSS